METTRRRFLETLAEMLAVPGATQLTEWCRGVNHSFSGRRQHGQTLESRPALLRAVRRLAAGEQIAARFTFQVAGKSVLVATHRVWVEYPLRVRMYLPVLDLRSRCRDCGDPIGERPKLWLECTRPDAAAIFFEADYWRQRPGNIESYAINDMDGGELGGLLGPFGTYAAGVWCFTHSTRVEWLRAVRG